MSRTTLLILAAALALGRGAVAEEALVSHHRSVPLPLDPFDLAWAEVRGVTVALAGQAIVEPMVSEASIDAAEVRSLNNGQDIAFRLTWTDPGEDRFQTVGRFSDAVAVQVPYRPSEEVPITMGGEGDRVLILHWAAFRQENVDNGYADVAKLHPDYAYDWYPHAEPPYRYPQDWYNQYALNYLGGEKVFRKNTVRTPVREVVAEGFGSSTWKDVQRAEGKGVYRDGAWHVVIKRRFVEENSSNPDWGPGRGSFLTVAVWEGGHRERGARKALGYAWVPLAIEGQGP